MANNLDEAFNLYKEIVAKSLDHKLSPYMKEHYYDKLKEIFETL